MTYIKHFDPRTGGFVFEKEATKSDGRWVPGLDAAFAHGRAEAAKSDGQVAHETFHGKLAELNRGNKPNGVWPTLEIERKAAWEAAAKAVRDKRKTEELKALYCDKGASEVDARQLFVNNEPAKFCFPHSNEKPFVEFKSGLRMALGEFARNGLMIKKWRDLVAQVPDLIIADECDTFAPEQQRTARLRLGRLLHERLEQAMKGENNKMQQQDQIKALNAEVERLLEEKAEALEQVSDFRIDCDEQAARADRLTQEQVELRGRLAEVQGERDAARHEREALTKELMDLRAKVRLTEQANADLLEMLDSLLHERSGGVPTFQFERHWTVPSFHSRGKVTINARRVNLSKPFDVHLNVATQSISDVQRRQARGY